MMNAPTVREAFQQATHYASLIANVMQVTLHGVPEIYVTAGMITHSPSKDLGSFFWRQW